MIKVASDCFGEPDDFGSPITKLQGLRSIVDNGPAVVNHGTSHQGVEGTATYLRTWHNITYA